MKNSNDTGYSTQVFKLIVKGDDDTIKIMRKTVDMVFTSMKLTHPDIRYEWDNCGYTDELGGHHDSGVGWSPDGRYCGECDTWNCSNCKIWEWRQKNEFIDDRNIFKANMRAKLVKAKVG